MKVKTVLNNNVLLAIDSDGKELVLRGKSLGFNFKRGDVVTREDVENIYSQQNGSKEDILKLVFPSIPSAYFKLAENIAKRAQEKLSVQFSLSQSISLVDHISFALSRHEKGIMPTAPVYPILKHMFPNEYEIGLEAVRRMREETNINVPDNEAFALTMHLVNAFQGQHDTGLILTHTRSVENIINIVRVSLDTPLNENSINFSRFVTHLQFFIQRIINDDFSEKDVTDFLEDVIEHYPDAYRCACRIKTYIENTFSITLGNEELLYLAIHINRVST